MVLLAALLAPALVLPLALPTPPRATQSADALARYGLVAAVSTQALAFAGGVALVGADEKGGTLARAGWLTLGAGFVAGPLFAHGAARSWLRGAVFAIVPTVCLLSTTTLLGQHEGSLDQLPLPKQRLLWVFTSAGLVGSVVAVVDAALRLPTHDTLVASMRLAPSASPQSLGVVAWGTF
jgi:hypothetical protein